MPGWRARSSIGAAGHETTLYSFLGAPGGSGPGAITIGPGGDVYGTTYAGGPMNAGVVYKLDAAGHETVLYSFTGGADGANPSNFGAPALDAAGNVYGTAVGGGSAPDSAGFGVV
jgi:uncharacterized repeat protein (TIGR03803 family)